MTGIIITGVIILVIGCFTGYVIAAYNKLIKERLKVENQFSQIDVILKQRNDTIPNFVNVVSGYATHEKELLREVTDARSRYMASNSEKESFAAADDIQKTLSRLIAVAENYPELKANANFMHLEKTLTELEEKIATYRQFYNDTVMRYNRQILLFPSSLIAKLFHFEAKPFFEASSEDKVLPEVKF